MPPPSWLSHWLVWCLSALLSMQIVLLASSGPDSSWRGAGYTAPMLVSSTASACASLWALWRLHEWPAAAPRIFIAVTHLPLLASALALAGI